MLTWIAVEREVRMKSIGFLVPLWLLPHPLQLVLIMTGRKNLREG